MPIFYLAGTPLFSNLGRLYMEIFVNKPLKNSKNLPEIIKSINKRENNHKNSFFDLGRNPLEIVHGPFIFFSFFHFLFSKILKLKILAD
jgi:hypothetical protein